MMKRLLCCSTMALLVTGEVQAGPLKVALVETLSGSQASTGLLYRASVNYEIAKINAAGGFRGEPVELVEYDNQGGPVGAADRVKVAIADGARVILQGSSSAVAGQVSEDVRKYNLRNKGKEVAYINLGGEALELTGDKCHFYAVRTSPNAAIRFQTLTKGMKELGLLDDKVYSINQNYSWGVDVQNIVKGNAAAVGYTVVGETLHDVNKIQDFSPYVAQINKSGAGTVLTGNWSNDLLLLMKAVADAQLNVRFGTAFLDQPGNVGNAGAVAEGHMVAGVFNPEFNPASSELAEDYKAVTGHYPSYVEPTAIFGMQLFGAALKSLDAGKGDVTAKDIILAIEATSIQTPAGEMSIRAEDHQAELPMIVQQVSKDAAFKVDGSEYGFKPLKAYGADDSKDLVQASCQMKRPG